MEIKTSNGSSHVSRGRAAGKPNPFLRPAQEAIFPLTFNHNNTMNHFKCIALILMALFSSLNSFGQAAARTSFSLIPETTYDYVLSYNQDPLNPDQLAGVEFYVFVYSTGTPTLTLKVPDGGSWIFDDDNSTEYYVDTPDEVGTDTFRFAIYAYRKDVTPQCGEGQYLEIDVDGGIVIVLEDFPLKEEGSSPLMGETTFRIRPLWENSEGQLATSMRVSDVSGKEILHIKSIHSVEALKTAWTLLPSQPYLVEFVFPDKSTLVRKVVK